MSKQTLSKRELSNNNKINGTNNDKADNNDDTNHNTHSYQSSTHTTIEDFKLIGKLGKINIEK